MQCTISGVVLLWARGSPGPPNISSDNSKSRVWAPQNFRKKGLEWFWKLGPPIIKRMITPLIILISYHFELTQHPRYKELPKNFHRGAVRSLTGGVRPTN